MLSKQQIEKEAAAYTNENAGSGFEFQAFVTGAEWAAEQVQAENERLTEALLWAIADLETMHDSAGTPPGERYLIEKLKKAME